MNKFIVSILGLIVLSGCAYDYYRGDIKYTQDGKDCIFAMDEAGYRFSKDIKKMRRDEYIVYRNTKCRDLYRADSADVAPVVETPKPCTKKCNVKTAPVVTRKYYVIG